MKKPILITAIAIAVCTLTGMNLGWGEEKATTKEIMRLKLGYSQNVLVGITTENFDMIDRNAERLVILSKTTNWYSRQTPEYDLFVTEFRRQAEALQRAGKEKNVDAASLAYVQMTLSCVSCHKYIRAAAPTKTSARPADPGLEFVAPPLSK
jgi:hypothetical protein